MHKNAKVFLIFLLSIVILSACESTQEQLGLTKSAPDEFQVVKRAPLQLPPDYSLRPPQPGAPRPQEQASVEQARKSVFGESPSSGSQSQPTTAEGALLRQAGAEQTDPSIRRKVDEESVNLVDENQPVIDKLLSIGRDTPPPASVVDASKEAERLRHNQEKGKPVTEGETPSVDD